MSGYRILGLWLAGVAGCCKQAPASKFPTGEDALDRMKATFACANGIQGIGKIDHFGERGRVRGDASAFAVNPARIRIDIGSAFGATPYTLTSDGKQFTLNDVPNKKFFVGPASACNLARLTQVPIPGHALVYLLRGEAPLLKHDRGKPTVAWECGHYRVDVPSGTAKQTVLLEVYDEDYALPWDKQRLRVVGLTTEQQGAILYKVEMKTFRKTVTAPARTDPDGVDPPVPPSGGACQIEVPHSIHVEVPYSSDDVLFQYNQAHLNPPLLEGTFTQPQPPGSIEQYVDCGS
jgi:hypothetical protein